MIIKKKTGVQSTRADQKAWEAHQKKDHPEFFNTYCTRRELFEQGLTGVTATLMAPSLLSLLLRSKEAQAAIYSQRPSFIFTMSGGASFGPEVVLSDINGGLTLTQAAHAQLSGGLQTTLTSVTNPISMKYGAGLWTRGLLFNALEGTPLPAFGQGIQITAASQMVRDNLRIVVFQHSRTDDDTSNNPNVPSHLISASALQGTNTVPMVRGIQFGSNSEAGGTGRPSMALPGFKPGSGNSIADLAALTSLQQGALTNYSNSQVRALSRAIASFAQKQMSSSMMGRGEGTQKLVTSAKEAADNMETIVSNPPNTNVFSDASMVSAFGLPATAPATPTAPQIIATNVKMVLDGVAPLSVMDFNGYDYHLNPSSAQAAVNQFPGVTTATSTGLRWRESLHPNLIDRTIRTLNAMALKGKSGTISWVTDGSVRFSSGRTTDLASATGEGGQTGHTAIMFLFSHPSDRLPPVQRFYLGGFDAQLGGAITDTSLNILARGPEYEGYAIYATFLGSRGALTYDQINELLPKELKNDRAFIDNLMKMNMFIR